ncbi:UDP-glucose/GDP-mannose dehydrogenase family protein [Mycetocola tolaasinivorans]|uniref:UDP-glucose 6-dehydrogenase n=1 Tax=Mycetocola tolaasinivorans TaxID=76635 RepID=A0A3L7ACH9_9MICO|nr:UDP-glucose/GDP-mannose dehydrogenase family protein [Mycetocola tolaasinivorans]RLP77438.1 UDP-glucose/GDP-mannose dehydrogenase family protein [Mycetocola tolaasinivorans]
MQISVIGCGYLGAVHAAALAVMGHEVVGIDVDERKIADLSQSRAPFFEPGLPEALTEGFAAGRLAFSSEISEAKNATVHFIAVGTPQKAGSNAADLTYVFAAVEALMPHLKPGDLVVGKSTVPVGTARRIAELIAPTDARLAWNPEFLREGFAVNDSMHPDRIVYGLADDGNRDELKQVLDAVYATPIAEGAPVLVTELETAELVKVSANAFLATKISFINSMAEIAEATGADVTELADAIGLDARIGRRFLNAGVGFGGGCLPKDIRALMAHADEIGVGDSVAFLKEVDEVNLRRRAHVVSLAAEMLGGSVAGKRISLLGLSFKPESDDIRDSPALSIARLLSEDGASVVATDPEAIENARRVLTTVEYADSVESTVANADLVILLTEWKSFVQIDPSALSPLVSAAKIIDGRNVLDAQRWLAAGWDYRGMGRYRHEATGH